MRLLLCQETVEMTNYSVTDIAYEAGYSSPSLFIKRLRR